MTGGVALVITDLDVGGAERALTALATRLEPVAVAGRGLLPGRARAGWPRSSAGRACRANAWTSSRRNPFRAVARLAARLRRFGPELVQSFLFHANLAARLAAPWAGRPLGGRRPAGRRATEALAPDPRSLDLAAGRRRRSACRAACCGSAATSAGSTRRG